MKMVPVLKKRSKVKINLALMLVVELTQTVFPQVTFLNRILKCVHQKNNINQNPIFVFLHTLWPEIDTWSFLRNVIDYFNTNTQQKLLDLQEINNVKNTLSFPFASSNGFLDVRETLHPEDMRRKYVKCFKSSSHTQRKEAENFSLKKKSVVLGFKSPRPACRSS